MKYQKLHKFNARQEEEEGSVWWPENDHRSRDDRKNRNEDQNTSSSADNSQKVRSLMKAMHRVLSSGEKQKQLQKPHDSGKLGFNQLREGFDKLNNGIPEKVSANAQ